MIIVNIYFDKHQLGLPMLQQEYEDFQEFMLNDKLKIFEFTDILENYYLINKRNISYYSIDGGL